MNDVDYINLISGDYEHNNYYKTGGGKYNETNFDNLINSLLEDNDNNNDNDNDNDNDKNNDNDNDNDNDKDNDKYVMGTAENPIEYTDDIEDVESNNNIEDVESNNNIEDVDKQYSDYLNKLDVIMGKYEN